MSDIVELQRRITAAMDQVAFGLDKLGAVTPAAPDAETLRQLEDERTAYAQLQERVRGLRTKSEAELATLRALVDEGDARMAQLDIELQRVRRANAQLSDACAALRTANSEGVGDPHLINHALLAELEALRAVRAADVAEASVIMASLQPLIDAAQRDTGKAVIAPVGGTTADAGADDTGSDDTGAPVPRLAGAGSTDVGTDDAGTNDAAVPAAGTDDAQVVNTAAGDLEAGNPEAGLTKTENSIPADVATPDAISPDGSKVGTAPKEDV